MPLHVVQLGPYPPPEGGISRNILAIRDELASRGDRCSIIATSRSSEVKNEPDVYHPRSSAALAMLLSSLKFDVLHLHIGGAVTARVLALAFVCSIFGRGRTVLTLHSGAYPLTEEARDASPGSIRGRIFRRFSRIIAVSEPIADVFRRYGVPPGHISIIPPYALQPPNEATMIPKNLAAFAECHSPLILGVGGLEREYDPVFQISAMSDVLANFPNAGLMIIGDGSMRGKVMNEIAATGYDDKIFLAGNVPHAVTLRLISVADILLRTTLFDGDAISVREALFLGTPVIATDNGMRPAGVHLIPVGDKARMVRAINEIASGTRQKTNYPAADRSNIAAVCDLYGEL